MTLNPARRSIDEFTMDDFTLEGYDPIRRSRPPSPYEPAVCASMAVTLVAAVARDGVIGRAGDLAVRIPEDLRRFKALTMGHTLVMGRKTWDSIGRALPGRRTIVVTRQPSWAAVGADVAGSVGAALAMAQGRRSSSSAAARSTARRSTGPTRWS